MYALLFLESAGWHESNFYTLFIAPFDLRVNHFYISESLVYIHNTKINLNSLVKSFPDERG